jgi:hypothetical protein
MGAAEGVAQHSFVCTMPSLAMSCLKSSLLKAQSARDADGLCNFTHFLLSGAFVSLQYTLSYFPITA